MKPLTIRPVSPPQDGGPPTPPPLPVDQKKAAREPRSASSVWVLRLVLLVGVLGSASLGYWSFAKRLQPVSNELKLKTAEMSRIADEIERLQFKWGPQQIESTKAEYAKARQVLFDGDDVVAAWRKQVGSEASMRVVELVEQVGEPAPHPALTNEVSILPVTLTVQPLAILVTTNTPYSRVVNFVEGAIQNTDKRLELVSLSVDGNSNSVSRAVAVVNLFTTSPKSP